MEQWLASQRIGLAAYAVQVIDPDYELERFTSAWQLLFQNICTEPGQRPESRRSFFLSLPPVVLTLLSAATQQEKAGKEINAVFPEIKAALHNLSKRDEPSVLGRVQVWASHVLLGQGDAYSLVSLWRTLFGNEWPNIGKKSKIISEISLSIETLRDPWSTTEERCRAISRLNIWLSKTPHWPQIENILYQYQFYWPLLVFDQATGKGLSQNIDPTNAIAFSFPVAVDILFDGHDAVLLKGVMGNVLLDEWKRHLQKAARIGKELWRAKHGNCGSFKYEVNKASVIYDFSNAQKIAHDFAQHKIGKISLEDGSADAYFTQAVLHKLLGRSSTLMSAVSGLIGNQIINPEDGRPTLNYKFIPPDGLKNKLAYVFACKTFERVALAKGTEAEVANILSDETTDQSAEIVFPYSLQNLADTVQVRGWRQQHYIRCPEIAWAAHTIRKKKRSGLLDSQDERVQNLVKRLNQNFSTVIWCETSPIVVISALWYINTYQREITNPNDIPPSLSWAFIRPIENEHDVRFWQLLWKVMGASNKDFYEFIHHPSTEEAVTRIANALNRFMPGLDSPGHRAPDVIVIVGSQLFKDNYEESTNPTARAFMVHTLLEKLSLPGRLQGPHDDRLFSLIGKTRIILLPRDEHITVGREVSIEKLCPEEVSLLRALAVFKGGFPFQVAQLMLSEIQELREVPILMETLKKLEDKDALRKGQGIYHIPFNLSQYLQSEENLEKVAQRYYRAGCALAPYTVGQNFPALSIDKAFNPENTHEAELYFSLALQYAKRTNQEKLRQASWDALDHLSRYIDLPDWSTLENLLKAGGHGKRAYEMAKELLKHQHDACVMSHPYNLITAARATIQWMKSHGENSNNPKLGQILRQEINSYFRQALEYCSTSLLEETDRLYMLSSYAVYLYDFEPDRKQDIQCLSEQVSDLLHKGINPKGIPGQWFDFLADEELDHAKASSIYKLGIGVVPEWSELWIKGLGSASLGGLSEQVNRIKNTCSMDDAIRILSKSRGLYQRRISILPMHALDRWNEGLRLFSRFWYDPRVHLITNRLFRISSDKFGPKPKKFFRD